MIHKYTLPLLYVLAADGKIAFYNFLSAQDTAPLLGFKILLYPDSNKYTILGKQYCEMIMKGNLIIIKKGENQCKINV